MESVNIIFMY